MCPFKCVCVCVLIFMCVIVCAACVEKKEEIQEKEELGREVEDL